MGKRQDGEGAAPRFIHLRVHSAYSLLEGALPIARLVELARADGMPALAITDTNNLFGALEFSEKLAAAGIQPIIGCSLAVDLEEAEDGGGAAQGKGAMATGGEARPAKRGGDGTLALLAKDEAGYANLVWLASEAWLGTEEGEPAHVTLTHLCDHAEGLIALTGGPEGPIDRALREGLDAVAAQRLERLAEIFPDRLYVELQRHGLAHEQAVEPTLLRLAYGCALPIVATNEAYFPAREDYEAHDALICIAEGRYVAEDDRRRLSPEHYFKSAAEMVRLFADLPEALESTVEIAQRCAFRPTTRAPILPQFVSADGTQDDSQSADASADTPAGRALEGEALLAAEAQALKEMAEAGLEARLAAHGVAEGFTEADYRERLAHELAIIERMKYPGYFLIVADFIRWAKEAGVPVGPGRGSGAGSVVAWALTITDLDPIRFGLLFERFLNPERVSMPDFDIDFCQERRDEVIRYVQSKYGADRVAQIITFGKLQARAVLRDVGRVLQMPYGQVDRLCKLVPNNPANPVTLAEAIAGEPRLREAAEAEPIVAKLLEIAQRLEGLYRHASTHAAGVVIGDRPLRELVPLYRDPRSPLPATQFNMKWVEPAGLVKFDFLGLKTLTVIEKAVALIRAQGVEVDIARIGLDDEKTYELLSRGDTVGVFQLESTGMRESLRKLRPDRFEDIVAMVALYRPGPMDNIPTYIARKMGEEEVDYLHPLLEPILKETYGVIIYQEQVMQIAQVLSGYSLGEADLLRRAMGKKNKEEMARQKARFVEGALEKGVERAQAEFIFELVDKFAGYGFNKSHAVAYALLAYQTAWLKANHPIAFLAATMTLDMGNTDKLAVFAREARRAGIVIEPPCVNASDVEFAAEEGAIRYSLAALKNIGRQAVEHIRAERESGGPFRDLADFARRISPRAVNKRALETLAAAGAFDALNANRAEVHANIDTMLALAQRTAADREAGQDDLFAMAGTGGQGADVAPLELRTTRPWQPMERLKREFDAIGFFLSGHPLDQYDSVLAKLGAKRWSEFEAGAGEGVSAGLLAGIVTACRERKSKTGTPYAFAAFSDQTGQFEAVIFSDVLNACREHLEPGVPVLVRVEAERDGETVKLRAHGIEPLEKASRSMRRGIRVFVAQSTHLRELGDMLASGGKGEVRLVLRLEDRGREVELRLPGGYDVSPMAAGALATVPGVLAIQEL